MDEIVALNLPFSIILWHLNLFFSPWSTNKNCPSTKHRDFTSPHEAQTRTVLAPNIAPTHQTWSFYKDFRSTELVTQFQKMLMDVNLVNRKKVYFWIIWPLFSLVPCQTRICFESAMLFSLHISVSYYLLTSAWKI